MCLICSVPIGQRISILGKDSQTFPPCLIFTDLGPVLKLEVPLRQPLDTGVYRISYINLCSGRDCINEAYQGDIDLLLPWMEPIRRRRGDYVIGLGQVRLGQARPGQADNVNGNSQTDLSYVRIGYRLSYSKKFILVLPQKNLLSKVSNY